MRWRSGAINGNGHDTLSLSQTAPEPEHTNEDDALMKDYIMLRSGQVVLRESHEEADTATLSDGQPRTLFRHMIFLSPHEGYDCDGCDLQTINGIRWSCQDCPEPTFNLCNKCWQEGKRTFASHDGRHRFKGILPPGVLQTGRSTQESEGRTGASPPRPLARTPSTEGSPGTATQSTRSDSGSSPPPVPVTGGVSNGQLGRHGPGWQSPAGPTGTASPNEAVNFVLPSGSTSQTSSLSSLAELGGLGTDQLHQRHGIKTTSRSASLSPRAGKDQRVSDRAAHSRADRDQRREQRRALASFGDHDETPLGEQSLVRQAAEAEAGEATGGDDAETDPAQLDEEDEVLRAATAVTPRARRL